MRLQYWLGYRKIRAIPPQKKKNVSHHSIDSFQISIMVFGVAWFVTHKRLATRGFFEDDCSSGIDVCTLFTMKKIFILFQQHLYQCKQANMLHLIIQTFGVPSQRKLLIFGSVFWPFFELIVLQKILRNFNDFAEILWHRYCRVLIHQTGSIIFTRSKRPAKKKKL